MQIISRVAEGARDNVGCFCTSSLCVGDDVDAAYFIGALFLTWFKLGLLISLSPQPLFSFSVLTASQTTPKISHNANFQPPNPITTSHSRPMEEVFTTAS